MPICLINILSPSFLFQPFMWALWKESGRSCTATLRTELILDSLQACVVPGGRKGPTENLLLLWAAFVQEFIWWLRGVTLRKGGSQIHFQMFADVSF